MAATECAATPWDQDQADSATLHNDDLGVASYFRFRREACRTFALSAARCFFAIAALRCALRTTQPSGRLTSTSLPLIRYGIFTSAGSGYEHRHQEHPEEVAD
jgi:hypothetical protein